MDRAQEPHLFEVGGLPIFSLHIADTFLQMVIENHTFHIFNDCHLDMLKSRSAVPFPHVRISLV